MRGITNRNKKEIKARQMYTKEGLIDGIKEREITIEKNRLDVEYITAEINFVKNRLQEKKPIPEIYLFDEGLMKAHINKLKFARDQINTQITSLEEEIKNAKEKLATKFNDV